jgi:hypothetical protein
MSSDTIGQGIQVLIPTSCWLASVKLWRTGLAGRYRALLGFLLVIASDSTLILFFFKDFSSASYRLYWEIFQPLTWVFSVWVVLELYALILERHKGLATLGRWVQYAGFALSLVVSVATMLPRINAGRGSALLRYYYAMERGVDCGMLVFLLVMLLWLTRYPVPLSRNLILHSVAYSVLFFSNSLGLFARAFLGAQLSQPVTVALNGTFFVCVLSWLFFLNPKGEEVRVTVPRFSPEHEQQVLSRLETLNSALLRISRN